ncbi:MAG: DUF4214 domain-containing protein [Actinomycetia bacterium]|nr:DUF4214 domain-containing protein [Actinomycetes bacterium]
MGWHLYTIGIEGFSIKDNSPPPATPRPLTDEEWVQRDLNISQLRQHYGSTNEGFVKFLYDNILNRVWDREGLSYWLKQLESGNFSASRTAAHFIFSSENQNLIENMGNEEFINYLYDLILARTPDREGYEQWLLHMDQGMSKREILDAFLDSREWIDICNRFGVNP